MSSIMRKSTLLILSFMYLLAPMVNAQAKPMMAEPATSAPVTTPVEKEDEKASVVESDDTDISADSESEDPEQGEQVDPVDTQEDPEAPDND